MRIRYKLFAVMMTMALVLTSLPFSVMEIYADDQSQEISDGTNDTSNETDILIDSEETTGSEETAGSNESTDTSSEGTSTAEGTDGSTEGTTEGTAEGSASDNTGTETTTADDTETGESSDAEVPYSEMTEEQKAAARAAARAKVAECQKALNTAKSEQSKAQTTYNNIGRKFVEENCGSELSVSILTNLYKNNKYLKKYVSLSSYNKSIASALSVANLTQSANFIKQCNTYRTACGMEELQISYRHMCFAATSSAIAKEAIRLSEGNLAAEQFYHDENKSNAFPTLDGVILLMSQNSLMGYKDKDKGPYAYWYDDKGALYKEYLEDTENHPDLESLNYNSLDIRNQYYEVYADCGEFLNIMDSETKVTGFAHNTVSSLPVDVQCFSRNVDKNGTLTTPDQFITDLTAYAKPAKDALTAANAKVKAATADLNTAQAELDAILISIKGATIKGVKTVVYNGKAYKPAVKVYFKGSLLSPSSYKVTYKNNKNPGKATVTVTGIDAYRSSVSTTFTIRPKATYIKKLKKAKKAFTVKWKKQSTKVSGYQIQYCRKKSFKGAKTVTIKSKNTTSKKIKKLKRKKKYYVRIRTYKTVSGKRYYSTWSKVKAVKTK